MRTYEEYMDYRRDIVRKAVNKRRTRAKELGLCVQCIKEYAVPGKTLCPEYAIKSRERQHKYCQKLKANQE